MVNISHVEIGIDYRYFTSGKHAIQPIYKWHTRHTPKNQMRLNFFPLDKFILQVYICWSAHAYLYDYSDINLADLASFSLQKLTSKTRHTIHGLSNLLTCLKLVAIRGLLLQCSMRPLLCTIQLQCSKIHPQNSVTS